jgi:hypothetical protein
MRNEIMGVANSGSVGKGKQFSQNTKCTMGANSGSVGRGKEFTENTKKLEENNGSSK